MSKDSTMLPRKMDWMVTERAEDLKALMHDNATYIEFPPVGSSNSLMNVYGDHRVNIQRTVRAVMQLVCTRHPRWSRRDSHLVGLPILCRVSVASSGPVQCAHAFDNAEPDASNSYPEAGVLGIWSGGDLQGYVLRDAWLGARGARRCFHASGPGNCEGKCYERQCQFE